MPYDFSDEAADIRADKWKATKAAWRNRPIEPKQQPVTTYKLSINPYRIWHTWELPQSRPLEEWENEDSIFIKIQGNIYNVQEFCTYGYPVIDTPKGKAQLATNGYFMIACNEGNIYGVTITTITTI